MKHQFVLATATVFAMSGAITMAQAGGFVNFDDLCGTSVDNDTKVKRGGPIVIDGDCKIEVNNARLEINGVTVVINAADGDDGELEIKDVTTEGAAELIIKNANIKTDDRLKIEEAWDGGVIFKNNHVDIGDDLRVKPIGSGDLIFKNNRGEVGDDISLGDTTDEEGLDGDMDVRNNRIAMVKGSPPEFVAQSFDGDIDIRNNRFGSNVEEIEIRSAGNGDIGVRNNSFLNTEKIQEQLFITSQDGDVGVWNNTFGEMGLDEVDIDSAAGQCESKRNTPALVDKLACMGS